MLKYTCAHLMMVTMIADDSDNGGTLRTKIREERKAVVHPGRVKELEMGRKVSCGDAGQTCPDIQRKWFAEGIPEDSSRHIHLKASLVQSHPLWKRPMFGRMGLEVWMKESCYRGTGFGGTATGEHKDAIESSQTL